MIAKITLGFGLLALSSLAPALPTGGVPVSGTVNLSTSGGTLTVTNSNNAIINWQSFNIGAGETTRFNQPSSSSSVLNRVVTSNPSSIFGSLTSNGNVFLVNPNGILFGAGSQVSVGALTLSTFDIADAKFLAGQYAFTGSGTASIILDSSYVASTVLNIHANNGMVSGSTIILGALNVHNGLPSFTGNVTIGPILPFPILTVLSLPSNGGTGNITQSTGGTGSSSIVNLVQVIGQLDVGGALKTTGSGVPLGSASSALTAAGGPIQPGGVATSNNASAGQGASPVFSVSPNLEKRELGF